MKKLLCAIISLIIMFNFCGCIERKSNSGYENQFVDEGLEWRISISTSEPIPKTEYIGNKNSKKFHYLTCTHLLAEKNRVSLSNREEAIKKGYKPCGLCNP